MASWIAKIDRKSVTAMRLRDPSDLDAEKGCPDDQIPAEWDRLRKAARAMQEDAEAPKPLDGTQPSASPRKLPR